MIKVALRSKPIDNGKKSLYLDFYPAIPNPKTGKDTRREFLKMYVYEKPKGQIQKIHNDQTLAIADSIRQKKENILNKPEIYTEFEKQQLKIKELGEIDFVEYFRKLANKKKSSNYDNWISALNYLEDFANGVLKFADVNEKKIEEFKEFLLTTKSRKSDKVNLSQNSAVSYFNKVKACLKQAFKDGILQNDLNAKIDPIKAEETRRDFFSIDELNQLAKTPYKNELMKRAALFSALTGLAFKEIQNLVWGDITFGKDRGYMILSNRQKTHRDNYLPISEQAYSFTKGDVNPKKMESYEKVFKGLNYSAYHNKGIDKWVKDAGVDKKITFHCFRHTFATLQLYNGTDIYTVSKMLGHKNLATTQIYAKVVDESERIAADKIKLDL